MIICGQAANRKIAETKEEFNRLLILLRDRAVFFLRSLDDPTQRSITVPTVLLLTLLDHLYDRSSDLRRKPFTLQETGQPPHTDVGTD